MAPPSTDYLRSGELTAGLWVTPVVGSGVRLRTGVSPEANRVETPAKAAAREMSPKPSIK